MFHRVCHSCGKDKKVEEFPKSSSKCNACVTGRAKGTIVVCAECKREGKLMARGLCNTCYDRWVKGRVTVICVDCGETKPHHTHGRCSKCAGKARYAEHKQEILAWQRNWRKMNPERTKAIDKAKYQKRKASGEEQARSVLYYQRHPDRVATRRRAFHAKNPTKASHYTRSYESKKAKLETTLTDEQWKQKVEDAKGKCYYCGEPTARFHKEHRQPVSKGGGYTKENIVPACQRCNNRKNNKTEAEFREYLKKFP